MAENKYTILCVDNEEKVLHSLRRLLRKVGYGLLTSTSADEALELLRENDIQIVICDQRMPRQSGIAFLSQVKELYPDTIRIVLTGYTDIDTITEAINQGQIYKFLLKPWNDQNLMIEIKKAIDQYELIQSNKQLHQKIIEQNEELKSVNENLEGIVKDRTKALEIQNQALELSRAILEDLPIPIVGISNEGMIVLLNREVEFVKIGEKPFEIGRKIHEYFEANIVEIMNKTLHDNLRGTLHQYHNDGNVYDLEFVPLSGRFQGRGLIFVLRRPKPQKGTPIS